MGNGTPHLSSLKRTLAMLEAVIADGGGESVSALARSARIPVATAHRQVATLVAEGYLRPAGHGRHVAGPRLMGLLHLLDEKQLIANVAAPVLHRLAGQVRAIVQLGTFENDMVTYRIKTGQGAGALFTKVGMQLEAYCSGIGKMLLASLPEAERRAYLAGGPFVPLTPRTIVDPAALAQELERCAAQDFAVDDGEVSEGLVCMAVPVRKPDGSIPAAISVSQATGNPARIPPERLLSLLREAAREIELEAFG